MTASNAAPRRSLFPARTGGAGARQTTRSLLFARIGRAGARQTKAVALVVGLAWAARAGAHLEAVALGSAWQATAGTTTSLPAIAGYGTVEWSEPLTFRAREGESAAGAQILRFFVTDEWGNGYAMAPFPATSAAAAAARADFEAIALPAGWRKSTGYLSETIVLEPGRDAEGRGRYNAWRDARGRTWVQTHWSRSGRGIAQQIPGAPIWGGRTSDRIYGTSGDDSIHGAEGDDWILALGGDDSIHGDAGSDVVVLEGLSSDYEIVRVPADGSLVQLRGLGTSKLLQNVEAVQFRDARCSTDAAWRCETSDAIQAVARAAAEDPAR